MRAQSISLTAVVLLAITVVGPSRAENNEAKSRELFAKAAERYDSGQKAEALRLYEESYALVKRAKTLLNIGVVLAELGRDAEAANVLAKYAVDPDSDRERLPSVRQLLADLDKKLLRLDLDLTGDGPFTLGGVELGDGPIVRVVRVAPGRHLVRAGSEEATVQGSAGELKPVVLTAPSTEPPPLEGDGDAKPIVGAPEPPPPRPRERSILSHPALWTGALALIAGGVGGGYALSFRAAKDDLEEINRNSGEHPFSAAIEARDKAESRALYANIGFGVAGAAAITTVILVFVIDRDGGGSQEMQTAVLPWATPEAVGAAMIARF